MAARYFYKDVLPFATMATVQCTDVGLNTLFKAATLKGMSYHVFVVYVYAVAALVLLPAPFFSLRSRVLPPLSFSIFCRIVLLGIIGASSQIIGYLGISYSSPTLASAISNLTPAITFILAIIFRMEKLALRRASTQAKVSGSIVSILGAFVVTLYKGPVIAANSSLFPKPHQSLGSSEANWVVGGICLAAEYILVPLWYIVQTQIMKEYPAELTVVFFYDLCVSMIAAVVGLVTERTSSAWIIRPNIALASVLCSGVFGSCLSNAVYTWSLRTKGPLFVAMFKPLSIVIAVAMGVAFLGDTLYLGSVVGAIIIVIGFYTVMWGKAKEDKAEDRTLSSLESPSMRNGPLLQSSVVEENRERNANASNAKDSSNSIRLR